MSWIVKHNYSTRESPSHVKSTVFIRVIEDDQRLDSLVHA